MRKFINKNTYSQSMLSVISSVGNCFEIEKRFETKRFEKKPFKYKTISKNGTVLKNRLLKKYRFKNEK